MFQKFTTAEWYYWYFQKDVLVFWKTTQRFSGIIPRFYPKNFQLLEQTRNKKKFVWRPYRVMWWSDGLTTSMVAERDLAILIISQSSSSLLELANRASNLTCLRSDRSFNAIREDGMAISPWILEASERRAGSIFCDFTSTKKERDLVIIHWYNNLIENISSVKYVTPIGLC